MSLIFFYHLLSDPSVPAKAVSASLFDYLFLILAFTSTCICLFANDSNQEVISVSIPNTWHSNKNILCIYLIISFSTVTTQVTCVCHTLFSNWY